MSIEYVIDSADSTVRSTHVGQIPVEEEIAFLETVLSDSQFQRGMHALCNLSEATIDWSLNDLDRFRSFVENRKNVMGSCKWALLRLRHYPSHGPDIHSPVRSLLGFNSNQALWHQRRS